MFSEAFVVIFDSISLERLINGASNDMFSMFFGGNFISSPRWGNAIRKLVEFSALVPTLIVVSRSQIGEKYLQLLGFVGGERYCDLEGRRPCTDSVTRGSMSLLNNWLAANSKETHGHHQAGFQNRKWNNPPGGWTKCNVMGFI